MHQPLKLDQTNHPGYTAIATVLVIAAVAMIIGTTTSLLSIDGLQAGYNLDQGQATLQIVESCVEDTLLYLNENNSLPPSISLPEGSCSVTLNSQVGVVWTFTVAGSINGYTKSVQVVANRSSAVSITSWREL